MGASQMRPAAFPGMLRHHGRVAAGFANARGEAAGGQVVGGPGRGFAAILGMHRLGADAGDAQEVEQPAVRGRTGGVDMGQHLVQEGSMVGHGTGVLRWSVCVGRAKRKSWGDRSRSPQTPLHLFEATTTGVVPSDTW